MRKGNPLPALLRAFFQEWLAEQRSASIHTIRSYRDTWRLLLRFVAERKGCGVARLTLTDVSAGEVRAFLHHTEHAARPRSARGTADWPPSAASSASWRTKIRNTSRSAQRSWLFR